MNNAVYDFLKKYNMNSDALDMEKSCDDFVEQMKDGLAGNIKSMLMLPTYIGVGEQVEAGQKVIVLDAGGTNLRSAVVSFDDNGKAIIEQFNKVPMLGTQGELTCDEFFDGFADIIAPFEGQSDTVGFCFSFPVEALPNCDGKIMYLSKEVKVKDINDKILGEGINNSLVKKGLTPKKFVIINDTVATMLGAMAEKSDKQYDSYLGFILGTGTNTCYIEENKNITKVKNLPDGKMVINMECGNFDGFNRGEIDRMFDKTTITEGRQKYEKMVSGAYQGGVILATLKQAAQDGLFSEKTAQNILNTDQLTMYMIDCFCAQPDGDNFISDLAATQQDKAFIFDIIDDSFERAAKAVTVNLGGILLCTGNGTDKQKPVCVSAEGTTFYKSVLFRPKLDKYVKEFLNDKKGVYLDFVKAEDSTLIGSAVAGLCNR